jgi:hypothetical protein
VPPEARPFAADVASFRLHLAAENKAAGTIRIYTEAPLWFAATCLLGETDKTRWGQVDSQDVQRWVTWLLGRDSESYGRQCGVPAPIPASFQAYLTGARRR